MTRDQEAASGVERADLFEQRDVSANGVIIFFAGLFGSLIVIIAVVWGLWSLFTHMRAKVEPFPGIEASQIPPEPRIQVDPHLDVWRMRAHEDAVLDTYGWVDRQAGTVHIPISRAMDLLAKRGLPVWTGAGPMPGVPDTGPESGGPQTGQPMPRFHPAQPSVATESSRPLRGAPQAEAPQ
jgi:hypothetical protein